MFIAAVEHIGSMSSTEAECALDVLLTLVTKDRSALLPFAVFVKRTCGPFDTPGSWLTDDIHWLSQDRVAQVVSQNRLLPPQ